MNRSFRLQMSLAAVFAALLAGGCATYPPAGDGVSYSHRRQQWPRPVRIHVLRIDLDAPGVALHLEMADDPDGDGPAETVLVDPRQHADNAGIRLGVNANAWAMVPPPPEGESSEHVAGGAADVCGWVLGAGVERSPPEEAYWSFWLDADGVPRIGRIDAAPADARMGVAGFGALVLEGKVRPGPSDVRHPRTAIGIDATGRQLVLVVVDGRQEGYSEGMSEHELAKLMRELGCEEALNLDGGGSSVMIRRDARGVARIVNQPSGSSGPRPIPVLLGVR